MNTYKNGNTIVSIKSDGTKIRYVPDNQQAEPEFPESIDMKITNKCSMNCPMCHEKSTPYGYHGNLNHPLLDSLRPYTELAVGGGDPLSHPDLEFFLKRMKDRKVICNITVHWKQFLNNYKTLKYWEQEGLIHGVGVSVTEVVPEDVINMMIGFPNLVVHAILGIINEHLLNMLSDKDLNVLLLGYKVFGRGVDYRFNHERSIDDNIMVLSNKIETMYKHFRAVSFDNLAIKQLKLKEKMTPAAWKQFYMGDDGTFTMYVDLVKNEYAVSSTSPERNNIDDNDIETLFANIRRKDDALCTK